MNLNKIAQVFVPVFMLLGCAASQDSRLEMRAVEATHLLNDGSKLISIRRFEVFPGLYVSLMDYINKDNELCYQWVSAAVKEQVTQNNHSRVTYTVSLRCGGYEIRRNINGSLNWVETVYVPTGLRAISEFRTPEGLKG